MKSTHDAFMTRAVQLAWFGKAAVKSNPMVGAVIVKEGEIIAEGYHEQFGGPHAEVNAIEDAKKKGLSLINSTLYVTLEPCCHYGKQGPCTEAILKTEIQRVVYAYRDPDDRMRGKGLKQLEKAGIQTEHFENAESRALNEIYHVNKTQKRPFIHIKTACTLDGKITLEKGNETSLGNPKSMKRVHQLRAQYDAILVGINTLLIDDPRLTTRGVPGENPIRIVLDRRLRTPQGAQIFKEKGHNILVTTQKSRPPNIPHYPNTTLLECESLPDGTIDLEDLVNKLYQREIRSVLIEGGEGVNTSFLEANQVDRMTLIVTPHRSSKMDLPSAFDPEIITQIPFEETVIERVETDLWITGKLR